MKHSIQICTQDKVNMKKKKRTHTTIQQWPGAYLLHRCCNNYYAEKLCMYQTHIIINNQPSSDAHLVTYDI